MALQCQVTLNTSAYSAGATPPPQATVTVYNPNAVAVVVTAIQMRGTTIGSTTGIPNRLAMPPSSPPTGPGMTTTVPALSSINIGPFPIVVGSAANLSPFQMVNQTGNLNPINPQAAMPAPFVVQVGADVYGSDGSTNAAGVAPLNVNYASALSPQGFQGGYLNFGVPADAVLGLITGVL